MLQRHLYEIFNAASVQCKSLERLEIRKLINYWHIWSLSDTYPRSIGKVSVIVLLRRFKKYYPENCMMLCTMRLLFEYVCALWCCSGFVCNTGSLKSIWLTSLFLDSWNSSATTTIIINCKLHYLVIIHDSAQYNAYNSHKSLCWKRLQLIWLQNKSLRTKIIMPFMKSHNIIMIMFQLSISLSLVKTLPPLPRSLLSPKLMPLPSSHFFSFYMSSMGWFYCLWKKMYNISFWLCRYHPQMLPKDINSEMLLYWQI